MFIMLEDIRYNWNMGKFIVGMASLNDAYYKEGRPETALKKAHTADKLIRNGAKRCMGLVERGYKTESWEPKELKKSIAISSLYVKKMEGTIDEEEFRIGLEENNGLLSRFMQEPTNRIQS